MAEKLNFRDEIFDENLISSMKQQMQPSDEVVSDLIAKIAELEASETATNAKVIELKPAAKTEKHAAKRVWYYVTCAAASFVILVSAFGIFGGETIDKIKSAFNAVVEDPTVITDPVKPVEGIGPVTDPENDNNKDPENNENPKKDGKDTTNEIGSPKNQGNNNEGNTNTVKDPSNENTDPGNVDTENSNPVNTDPQQPSGGEPSQDPQDPENTEQVLQDCAEVLIDGATYIAGSDTKVAKLSEGASINLEATDKEGQPVKLKAKALKSVSPSLAMIVKSEDDKSTVYMNSDYLPSTLGQFIKDADISSIVDYGICYYTTKGMGKNKQKNFKVNDIVSLVNTYLLSNTEARRIANSEFRLANTKIEFESTDNSTGLVMFFGVSPQGYLNIKMENEHHVILNEFTFDIGHESFESFKANSGMQI